MSKFKLGDKVMVRGDLEVGRYYDGYPLPPPMEKFKGKEGKVNRIVRCFMHSLYYGLDISDEYIFSPSMLEHVQEEGDDNQ